MIDGHASTDRSSATRRHLTCVLAMAALAVCPANGAELHSEDGLLVRWDNTLRYSAAFRITPQNPAVMADPNYDDGNRNFAPGLISNRLDLISAFDLVRGDVGLHVSAVAWFDTVYHARTDNDAPGRYNAVSVPPWRFPSATRDLHGQYASLEEALVFGNFVLDGMPFTVRVGRQTVIWGESLFFAENSIAAALAPVDEIRNAGAPGSYSTEVFLPVGQAVLSLQPLENFSLHITYQFEWRKSRLPGAGSYFSYYDFYDAGGERLLLEPDYALYRMKDQHPPSQGQFGVALRATAGDVDLGLYALRYHAKSPQLWLWHDAGPYQLFYPSAIELYGFSFGTYLGESSIAGEISARRNTPLVSLSPVSQYWQPESSYAMSGGYAAGDTLHAQVSSTTRLGPGDLWDSAELNVEAAANARLSVTRNPALVDPLRDRYAVSMRAIFEPRYFQVLPNLDISLPLGLGWNVSGRSSVLPSQYGGAGDIEIGVTASYRARWRAGVTLTTFFGSPYRQPFADRDFILFTVERTF